MVIDQEAEAWLRHLELHNELRKPDSLPAWREELLSVLDPCTSRSCCLASVVARLAGPRELVEGDVHRECRDADAQSGHHHPLVAGEQGVLAPLLCCAPVVRHGSSTLFARSPKLDVDRLLVTYF